MRPLIDASPPVTAALTVFLKGRSGGVTHSSRQIRSFPDSWPCIRTGQWKVLTVFPVFGTGSDVTLPISVWGCFFSFRNPARSELLATTRGGWTLSKKPNFKDLLEAAPDAMVGVD